MKTRMIAAFVALTNPLLAQDSSESTPNLGRYQIGAYEFFAEELPPGGSDSAPRSRIYVLPTLNLLPSSVEVFDSAGRSISSSGLSESIGAGSKDLFDCRISFRVGTAEISHFAKYLMVGQMQNVDAMAAYPGDLLTSRLLSLYNPKPLYETEFGKAIAEQVKPVITRYSVEIAPPQGLSMRLSCGGEVIGVYTANQSAYIANGSTVSIYCKDLSPKTARLLVSGKMQIECDMVLQTSRIQTALAEFDLNRFYEAVASEFLSKKTDVSVKKRDFYFGAKSSDQLAHT